MRKKMILAALVAIFLLTTVVAAYALTWYRVGTWTYQWAPYQRFQCITLPVYTGYTSHRVSLRPLTYDVDLYVYGYSSSWVYIGASAYGGLTQDRVIFSAATRNAYNTIIACGWGYAGSSYFTLYYDVGI
jgi:hypothetical protein